MEFDVKYLEKMNNYQAKQSGTAGRLQGSYRSWNFVISLSRPGKSWNLAGGHGKSWKIIALSMSER